MCEITQSEEFGDLVLVCSALANPSDVTFEWKRNGNETLEENEGEGGRGEDGVSVSRLTLDAGRASFGTYGCVAKNSLGVGTACEIDVQGRKKTK